MGALAILGGVALAASAQGLSPEDTAAAFTAAGFVSSGGEWRTDCYQSDGPDYSPGRIEEAADLNGDGLPEAIITEGTSFCYGMTAAGFMLVSKRAGGKWVQLYKSQGIPRVLQTRRSGWPEIEVGTAGICYSVIGWSGQAYAIIRHEYEGKPCRP